MMDPPVTNSPENALMPRRCEFESRPFLELPKPFLCAMQNPLGEPFAALGQNFLHRHPRIVLAVTDGALILLLSFELEDDDFIAAPVGGNLAAYPRRLHRVAQQQLVGIV